MELKEGLLKRKALFLHLQPSFGASTYIGLVRTSNQDNCGLWRSWGMSLLLIGWKEENR